jgi:hypothetical protein
MKLRPGYPEFGMTQYPSDEKNCERDERHYGSDYQSRGKSDRHQKDCRNELECAHGEKTRRALKSCTDD